MNPREIDVHIEELVLHGFEPANRWLIADALERELHELLTAKGLPPQWLSSPERIEAAKISSSSLTKSERAGVEIAAATYRGGAQ